MFIKISDGKYLDENSVEGKAFADKKRKETQEALKVKLAAEKKEAIAQKTKAVREANEALTKAKAL